MSAFVVSNNHIVQLIRFAAHHKMQFHFASENNKRIWDARDEQEAQHLCEVLFNENVRSVLYRYPQDARDDYPMTIKYRFGAFAPNIISPLAAIKACQCLDYQSYETDDWQQTDAYRLLNWIQGEAISALPGYDKADWELSEVKP